jgi:hypothetical protein
MAATRHTVSRAAQLFSQGAYFPLFNPLPGLPIDIHNVIVPGGSNPALPTDTGVIAASAANNIVTSSASTGADNHLVLNGSLVASGVATADVARNIVAAWTTSATITVRGTDYYGQAQTESTAAPGTSFTGKKAFKTVTSVTFSVAVTAATVGTGNAIGLPFLGGVNDIQQALMDGSVTTWTYVVGDQTSPATAITGDVRGTITFGTAPNGTHAYSYSMTIYDRTGGIDKKSGAFGVTPV